MLKISVRCINSKNYCRWTISSFIMCYYRNMFTIDIRGLNVREEAFTEELPLIGTKIDALEQSSAQWILCFWPLPLTLTAATDQPTSQNAFWNVGYFPRLSSPHASRHRPVADLVTQDQCLIPTMDEEAHNLALSSYLCAVSPSTQWKRFTRCPPSATAKHYGKSVGLVLDSSCFQWPERFFHVVAVLSFPPIFFFHGIFLG